MKRWLLLVVLGVLLISSGFGIVFFNIFGIYGDIIEGLIISFLGIIILFYGFKGAIKAFLHAAFPEHLKKQVRSVTFRHRLRRGPRIVVIGGGTGLSVLLRGLKNYTTNITAIVSVTDDGGSSGKLRGQFGILPPGDLRNCLVALADTEPTMEKLFDYRFNQGKGLEGHNLGNLLITAMTDVSGSFETAINEISKVLAIRGRVIPSTLENVVLAAQLRDGSMVMGETVISKSKKPIKKVYTIPNCPRPMPEAIEAIKDADAIILGPGSLYTSVIPNLLVPDIVSAIEEAEGLKIYVCNVMTQPGESDNYTASDHIRALYTHSSPNIVDYMIINNERIPKYYLEKYALKGSIPVEIDREKIKKYNIELVESPLIHESDYIRHDPVKLAKMVVNLVLDKKLKNPFNIIMKK